MTSGRSGRWPSARTLPLAPAHDAAALALRAQGAETLGVGMKAGAFSSSLRLVGRAAPCIARAQARSRPAWACACFRACALARRAAVQALWARNVPTVGLSTCSLLSTSQVSTGPRPGPLFPAPLLPLPPGSEMQITWNTRDATAAPLVRWGRVSGRLKDTAPARSYAYSRDDMCGPPATTVRRAGPPSAAGRGWACTRGASALPAFFLLWQLRVRAPAPIVQTACSTPATDALHARVHATRCTWAPAHTRPPPPCSYHRPRNTTSA